MIKKKEKKKRKTKKRKKGMLQSPLLGVILAAGNQ